MTKRAVLGASLAVLLLVGVCASTSWGQAVYGGIAGTVTDPQGTAIVGAKVTVTSLAKGTVEEATTNESGNYTVSHLIPDAYKVHIESPGFKSFDVPSLTVTVDSSVRLDAQLQIGAVTQSIEVSGEVPQLQTDKSDVNTTFTAQTVESIPIYNRNFTTLQLLSPGNQRMNGWNHAASENPQGSGQIMTQGQHFAGSAFELDGTDNQDAILGIIVINPNLESINEVKITSQDYDAEFGKAIGVVVTTQTKSGTNELHGSAFDFQRSNSNFARNPFTQVSGVPSGNWNQFGGTLGGPIKKDKAFFFMDYQGTRSHIGGSAQDRIPTTAEQGGNLSYLIAGCPNSPCTRIYDPFETTDATHQTLVLDASGNPIPLPLNARTQFPNNVIPTSRLSQQAQNLFKLLPAGGTGTGLNPNFFGSGNNVLDSDGFDVRGDYNATSKLQVFGRYSLQQFIRSGPGLFGTVAGGPALPSDPSVGNFAGTSNVRNQSLATGFDYTFSPTWLTDFRIGYFRYHVQTAPGGVGTTPATAAGIPGLNLGSTFTSGLPYFAVQTPGQQLFSFGYALGENSEIQCNCPLTESEHQIQFVNNWTHIMGNHSLKFGADIRYAHNLRIPSDAHRAGQLDFNNDITEGPGGAGGAGIGGFLLGAVSAFQRYVSPSTNASESQPRLFFYGQDTWRMTQKLTLNLGVRWEIYRPESAAGQGLGGWIDLNTGEVRIAGENGVNLEGNTSTSYKHLAPRIGIAYQVTPKTVVRMGYGRSYDIGVFGSIFGHFISQNLPVLGQQSLNVAPGANVFLLSQGPPSFTPVSALGGTLATSNCNPITDPTGIQPGGGFIADKAQCVGANGRPLQPDNVGGNARPFNNRIPSVDAWNASVQRQLTPTITATVAYVGNKGTHTFIGDNPAYNPNSQTDVGYVPGCNFAPGSFTLPNPATCPNGALPQNDRKPFYLKYGWTQGLNYAGNDADSNYESMQATVEKRFSNGLSLQSSYTFQHANNYDNNGYFNIDKKVGYGPSSDYRNNVFILTEVYQLPFGRGKKWANDMGRAADFLVGGWSLNSVTNFSSGLPFNYSLSNCNAEIDNGPCRPSVSGSILSGTRSGHPNAGGYWFQTTSTSLESSSNVTGAPGAVCFGGAPLTGGPWAQPGCDSFGDVGRNTGRGPRFFNTDFSVFKDFAITEKAKAQFQAQFFNIFNHANLDLPNGCVDCSNGGSITNIAYGSQMRAVQLGLKFTF
jgi:outer membrane receptor protein involved in Fe transport